MIRFLLAELWGRRSRSLGYGFGIIVAAVTFTLLTAAVNTGELRLTGTIQRNFRGAYDILVRPESSYTDLDRRQGLVPANFASGIFGGITRRQWQEIMDIPGVEVAAPVANLGYIAPFIKVRLGIKGFLNDDPVQLYRLRMEWSADRGLSRFPGQDSFVYFTRKNRIATPRYGFLYEVLPGGERLPVCTGFEVGTPPVPNSPFIWSTREGWAFQCFSERSPRAARANVYPLSPGRVGSGATVLYPILVAAIDPVQELRLLGLEESIVSGRFLLPTDRVNGRPGHWVVPMIASSRNYVDQPFDVTVERLVIPTGIDVPRILASARAFRFVTRLPGDVLGERHVAARSLFRRGLDRLTQEAQAGGLQNYWAASEVTYQPADGAELEPVPVRNPNDVYTLPCCGPSAGAGNQDVQFRRLQNHQRNYQFGEPRTQFRFDIVGRYDPQLIPGSSSLSRVPLGAYLPPALQPADASSREALGGLPLLPSANLGGYIQQPPFLLTTLSGLKFFTNPANFDEPDPEAPISVIRVRVAGVTGPDELSLARIRSVAQLIRQRTGLAVDIVAGSSPSPVLIELPAGDYGRPQLLLREEWVRKGVAITIVKALDRKSLALFALVLVVTSFFLVNGALASVRARRREIGTLACLGWTQGRIFRAVLGELAFVGLVAGLVGAALAAMLIWLLSLEMPLARALFVTPVAIVLAATAGFVPAWRAARGVPLDSVRPPVSERSSSGSARRILGVALVNLMRLPGRTLLGAGGLFIGVAALTVLLAINVAFRGTLVGSLLGEVVSIQVRGVDLLSVVFALLLSALSVADVLFLNIRERAAEFVTLRATGWEDRHLAALVATEGVGIGLLGGISGAIVGVWLAGAAGGGGYGDLAIAGGLAGMGAILVALIASLAPALFVVRMSAPTVLAEE
ncbi:MAG: ABC transporter permease [Actinobacteria bacterium]|nr:ABC transporter permease [Actinomycetota bacterium]